MAYYVICDDDCKYESMTKEQILTAIEQGLEQGYVSDPDSAVMSKIKEIRANGTAQIWVGTEAQFNAINPAPTVGRSVVRVGEDGVLYLCSDDTTLADMGNHINDKTTNPHNVTLEQVVGKNAVPVANGGTGASDAATARNNLGAVSKTGDTLAGNYTFNNSQQGFLWTTNDNTLFYLRPYPAGNLMQLTTKGIGTNNEENPSFNIENDGSVWFGKPLPITSGGTGATTAAEARTNLGITPENIGAVKKAGDTLTGDLRFDNRQNGIEWTTNDGTVFNLRPYPAGNLMQLITKGIGTNNEENPSFNIENDGSVWFGKPLPITSGGTGASDATQARENLGAAPKEHRHRRSEISDFPDSMPASDVHPWAKASAKPSYNAEEVGAIPAAGGNVNGWLDFGNATRGLRWHGNSGLIYELRPYVDSDIFQLVFTPPGGAAFGAMTINPDGTPNFAKPLPITSGGTGATDAAGARNNLGITAPILSDTNVSAVQRTFHTNIGETLIQSGITEEIVCGSGTVTQTTISFPKGFSVSCTVIVSLFYNNIDADNASMVNAFAGSYSNSALTIHFTNKSGGERKLRASWMAMGI